MPRAFYGFQFGLCAEQVAVIRNIEHARVFHPTLDPGDVVILDNLSSRKSEKAAALLR